MYDYIPRILPLTLEEAEAEKQKRLNATISARKAEQGNKGE